MVICEHNFLVVEIGVGGEVVGVVGCFLMFVCGVKGGDCVIVVFVGSVVLFVDGRRGRCGQETKDDDEVAP